MTDNPTFESAVQSHPPIAVPASQSDNDRYVTDITYTMNYKPEINPLLIDFRFCWPEFVLPPSIRPVNWVLGKASH